ncbi:SAM-dependent methyltransferase [Micromonospora sp. LOL_023]|uniref:SAM-dependent methyltransferase n=1 Tax=Micromonospora sp. LOL_023 TaxID=3345418 RepID=UPI003A87EB3D
MGADLDPLARTALWTASMRAREHARDDRLFEEPLAQLLATELGPQIMRGFEGEVQRGIQDPALAVRTRFFDEAIGRAADSGVRQFVFVAAGMDTRAYRLDWPAATVVFELDRPALLDLKRALVKGSGADPGCGLRPVGVDLLEDWMGLTRFDGQGR